MTQSLINPTRVMTTLSALTWGDPTATKHVLLIHGLTGSAQSWYRIAQAFASRGYFVTAPDLLGHGNARRGSDYTVAALAEVLWPLSTAAGGNDHPYYIVVGHSLGGVVVSVLMPLLKSTRSVQVILVDPPLEQTPESVAYHRNIMCDHVRNPQAPETFLRAFPSWAREDAISRSFSLYMCDLAAVESIVDVGLELPTIPRTAPDSIQPLQSDSQCPTDVDELVPLEHPCA